MKINNLPAKQAKRYLRDLESFEPHRQLLLKVGGGLLADEADVLELTEALAELTAYNLHVVLVHGGGPQLSEAIEKQLHHQARFIDGKRYTDEQILALAQSTFRTIGENLVKTFTANKVDAVAIATGQLFKAERDPALGLVGTHITATKTADIIDALKHHSVLVIPPLACDDQTGETLNVNADTIFRALATELKPYRMVSLTPTGGVLKSINGSEAQELMGGIDIRDIETMIGEGTVTGGMALKLRELAAVLNDLEIGSAISITKPSELLSELLTDQGSGTFIGKGKKIVTTDDLDEILPDLAALIKEVFNKSLPEGYEKRPVQKIYFTTDRLAFGIVTMLSDGTPYLDKLAVSPRLQGRGIGETLWYRITRDFPTLLWRSHVTNRYATWYHRHADIMKRQGEWILFGCGVDFSELEAREQELIDIPAMH
jgi:acetylglutamate kinase